MKLEDFAESNNLELVITYYASQRRYVASFSNSEVSDGKNVAFIYGESPMSKPTPNKAVRDYAKRIKGKLLSVDSLGPQMRKIMVPSNLR